jgi:galactose mutarotase-like enzyme
VEPMSSETDAFNQHDGLIVLEAGGIWQGTFRISLE